jgi:hypothetical protein
MSEQYINLGGGPSIGKVSVSESDTRGEGGPLMPQLVIPLLFKLDPQPHEKSLAVFQLRAALYKDQQNFPTSLTCQPIFLGQTNGFLAWSMSNGRVGSNRVELRFSITAHEIAALEYDRHTKASNVFDLYLKLEPAFAGLQHFNEYQPGQQTVSGPWDDLRFGMYSQMFPFWTSTVQTILLRLERTTWIERVLPGLGYDRLRLLEVALPPPLPGHGSAATEFDKARQALDERRYSDCVAACRGLIGIWETALGASRDQRMADVVASRLEWTESDLRRRFLDDLWKAANDIANVPHHPEGQPVTPQPVDHRDARLLFLVVASLSEYLGHI